MFRDDTLAEEIAEDMLADYELSEILEMNDLTDVETLSILIQRGFIGFPERYLDRLEGETEDED